MKKISDIPKLGWIRVRDGACCIVEFVSTDQTKDQNDPTAHFVHYHLRYSKDRKRTYERRLDRFLQDWKQEDDVVALMDGI
jgi:hypothetical protein